MGATEMTALLIDTFRGTSPLTGDSSAPETVEYMTRGYSGQFDQSGTGNDVRVYPGNGGSRKAFSFGRSSSAGTNFADFDVGGEKQTIIAGGWFRPKAIPDTETLFIFRHDADGVNHILVRLKGTRLQFLNGATVLATVGGVRLARWQFIAVKVTVSDTVGVLKAQLNTTTIVDLTNQDTRNAGSGDDMDTVRFQGGQGTGGDVENDNYLTADWFVFDDSGSRNNDLPTGEVLSGEALFPDAEGNQNDWAPNTGSDNSALVDEIDVDEDNTYISTSTATDTDLFTIDDVVDLATIDAVQVKADCRVTDASTFDIELVMRTGTTETNVAGGTVSDSVDYATFYGMFEIDPDTATDWTVSGLNGAEIGVETP